MVFNSSILNGKKLFFLNVIYSLRSFICSMSIFKTVLMMKMIFVFTISVC